MRMTPTFYMMPVDSQLNWSWIIVPFSSPQAYIEQFAYLITRLKYDKSLPSRATLQRSASHLSLLRDGHVSRFAECRLDLELADLYLTSKMKMTRRGLSQSRRLRDDGFQPFSMGQGRTCGQACGYPLGVALGPCPSVTRVSRGHSHQQISPSGKRLEELSNADNCSFLFFTLAHTP